MVPLLWLDLDYTMISVPCMEHFENTWERLLLVFCCRTCRSVFLPQPTYYKYRWYHIEHWRKSCHLTIRLGNPFPPMLSFQGHISDVVERLCVEFSKDRKSPHRWSIRSTLTIIGYQRHWISPVVCSHLNEQYVSPMHAYSAGKRYIPKLLTITSIHTQWKNLTVRRLLSRENPHPRGIPP